MNGIYGSGMHQFILDEAELGFRAAAWLDEEQAECGMAWLLDLQYQQWVEAQAA